jgi:uncharacterized protein involved in exopolysaccharide biosynthesis
MKDNNQLDSSYPKVNVMQEKFHVFFALLQPYLKRIWKRRKQFIWFNSVACVVSVIFVIFARGREYTTSLEILPDYGNKSNLLSGLGGLSETAAFAGINLSGETSTAIYQDLLISESVLSPVIYNEYNTENYAGSWVPDSLQGRYKLLIAITNLNKRIRTVMDRETKVLTVELRMPEGKLTAEVLNNIVGSLDNYVRTKRKSNASNQRIYIEKRLEQVKDSLKVAEDMLAEFRMRNKILDFSPQLQLVQTRFVRNVEIQQTISMELVRQVELAKIEEIRDTPILNIKEFAQNPVIPTSLGRRYQFVILVFFFLITSASYFAFEDGLLDLVRIAKEELKGMYQQLKN